MITRFLVILKDRNGRKASDDYSYEMIMEFDEVIPCRFSFETLSINELNPCGFSLENFSIVTKSVFLRNYFPPFIPDPHSEGTTRLHVNV